MKERLKECLYCNGKIVKKNEVERCSDCNRVYWTLDLYERLTGKTIKAK